MICLTPIVETINLKNTYLLEEVPVAARRKLDERRTKVWYRIFLVSSGGGKSRFVGEDFGENLKKGNKGRRNCSYAKWGND